MIPDVPSSVRAEEAMLAAVFREPQAIGSIAEWMRPEYCYLERHERILAAMLAAHARGEPPDRVIVATELDRAGRLSEIGGEYALIEIMSAVPHAAHIEQHARIVEHTATLRRIIQAGGQIAAYGYDQARDLDDVVCDVERTLTDALAARAHRDRGQTLRSVMDALFARIGSTHGSGGVVGVPTGYHDLDSLTGGFQSSDLILVAARPSLGKTSFALSLAYNVAMSGLPVGVFSLEMSRDQLGQRLLAMHTGVDMQRIRMGNLRADELDLVIAGMGQLSEVPIIIDDTPGLSIRDLQRRARRMHHDHSLGLLVVDYLQLMSGATREGRVQEVSEISRGIKALARELDIPVIALSQLSRAVEGRQSRIPMLADLRESGSLEQDADIVMFIYREEVYDKDTDKKGIAEIHISKHRNGPLGIVPLRFEARTTRFHHLDAYQDIAGYA